MFLACFSLSTPRCDIKFFLHTANFIRELFGKKSEMIFTKNILQVSLSLTFSLLCAVYFIGNSWQTRASFNLPNQRYACAFFFPRALDALLFSRLLLSRFFSLSSDLVLRVRSILTFRHKTILKKGEQQH